MQPSNKPTKTLLAIAAAGVALASTHAGAVTINTVGDYDEQDVQTNAVDKPTTSPLDSDQNLSSTAFAPLVLDAFDNDRGGVIDFDAGAVIAAGETQQVLANTGESFDVRYGTSLNQTLTVDVTGATINIELAGDGKSESISKANRLGANEQDFALAFSTPLSAFGITVLDRNTNASDRNLMLTLTLVDTTTVVVISDGVGGSPNGSLETDDTFFGYQASDTNGIVSASFDANNFQHYDDLGFIVVPEPASMALLGLGGLLLLPRRKRTA